MKRPLLAWPGTESLKLSLPLSLLFLKIFVSVYGTASLLAAARPERPRLYFDFELAFPFVPSLAAVYLTVGLALVATPFVLRTWREIVPFFFTLTTETLVGGLCFLLLPVEQGYPPRDAAGFWGGLFRVADTLNLDYNEVPSLHVTFAVTTALVFGRRCGRLGKSLFAAWALGVSGSTLFLHEHHLVDVAAGAALAVAAVATVHRRTSSAAFLEAVRIEVLCLREAATFARRHRRYLTTALAIYAFSLRRWRETRLLRAAWCLAQHVDDVLDGDRTIPGDPEAYARRVIRVLEGEAPDETVPAEVLAAFVRGSREPLTRLFEVLIEDRRRMDARRTMSAAELAKHHRKTFFYSLDLTLILAGSKLRAGDAPELIAALSWCSPVRDLREDLAKGLINIPAEVLAEAEGEDLLASPAVRAWLEEERRRGSAAIRALGERLPRIEDARGRAILGAFHQALAAWERKQR